MQNKDAHHESMRYKECNAEESKEFVRLLTTHQHRIYAYILALIPDWSVAEDILQDTTEIMWVKYAQTHPIENFTAWAMRIAHNKILNYITKHKHQRILFRSDMLDEIARQTEEICKQMDDRVAALKRCMSQLNHTDRRYLYLRYEENMTIKQIAQKVGRPIHGMYKKMARVHELLLNCIRRRLAGEMRL